MRGLLLLRVTGGEFAAKRLPENYYGQFIKVANEGGMAKLIEMDAWKERFKENPAGRDYLAKLTVAFLITAAGGFLATRLGWKLPESVLPIALALLIGGIAILIIEQYVAGRPASSVVSWNVAFWVGACQILAAVFPGTSRSAATIFAAMLAGLTLRPAATEFAFLVGIPTMFAATAYELLKVRGQGAAEDWHALAVGFLVSGVVAFVAVKWLLRYVQSHRFTIFAWYRIVLGSILLGLVMQGTLR